jgi:ComF family protein
VGPYEGILREAVYQLKYQGRLTLAEPLGKLMANTIRKELNQVVVGVGKERSSVLKPLVVPVPLHPNRLGDRGFNQAKVLAEVVARELSLELDAGFLVRTADTPSQTGFSREERRINLADAFTAGKSVAAILGCPIVLVDDVLTTGSTCEACARLLLDWGSGPVVVVTIATGKLKVSKN